MRLGPVSEREIKMPFSKEEYLKPTGKLKVTCKLHECILQKYLNSENLHALLVVLLGFYLVL